MSRSTSSLLIVGGGSAGWITALYLQQYFNKSGQKIAISLIESPQQGPIGVGEATVHSIRFLFAALGLDERELMRETNATLKLGIMFNNWMKPTAKGMHQYFHPFEQQQAAGQYDIASEWLAGQHHHNERYDQGVSLSALLAERGAAAKTAQHRDYQGYLPYAYHIDAVLLGEFLKRKAIERGVTHSVETVQDIKTHGEEITAVVTDKGDVSADFYIDCSGFKGLLINSLQDDNWISFKRELPCDRAVAIQCDYAGGGTPRAYTTATALNHGWAWQIDLANRRGNGYVYDSDQISPEQAEQELLAHLGHPNEHKKALHLAMRVGRLKRSWIGNCLAIGLSAGFIEPLESTGLHLINLGARLFATHYSGHSNPVAMRASYNEKMAGVYEDLKQFIVLHYCLTDRDDTAFWRAAQHSVDAQPGLADKLEIWRGKICEFMDLAGGYSTTFTDENYRYVLYGMQHYPKLDLHIDQDANAALIQSIRNGASNLNLQAIRHHEFLTQLHRQSA